MKIYKGNDYCLPVIYKKCIFPAPGKITELVIDFYTDGSEGSVQFRLSQERVVITSPTKAIVKVEEHDLDVLADGLLKYRCEYYTSDNKYGSGGSTTFWLETPEDYRPDPGYESGYTSGYTDGYSEGFESGYTSGYTDGEEECDCSDAYVEGYSAGVQGNNFRIVNSTNDTGTVTLTPGFDAKSIALHISYDGVVWEKMTLESATTLSLPAEGVIYLAGKSNTTFGGWQIKCNTYHKVEGDIMSLIAGNDVVPAFAFSELFAYNNYLVTASGLTCSASEIGDRGMEGMFQGCTQLEAAPTFNVQKVGKRAYDSMFHRCTSLVSAPALPATDLNNRCYYYMFAGCSSLTTAPALPAKTLAENCYAHMFELCRSLTAAPVLPAETLVTGCYKYMFAQNNALHEINCSAKNISAPECTEGWVGNIAGEGTFYCAPGMKNTWSRGVDGVPENWTIEEY